MKEQILKYLEEHPGARKREIASHLKIWLCNKVFLDNMYALEDDGKIYREYYSDPANMEFYDKFYKKA